MTLSATELDRLDPLAAVRGDFFVVDPDLIYLDGNSLGRLPRSVPATLADAVTRQWGEGLVRSWAEWFDLPQRLGTKLAPIIGAEPDTTLVCDSTTQNLYRLAWAVLARNPHRNRIVTDDQNFPSDLYVLRAVAAQFGGSLTIVASNGVEGPVAGIQDALGDDVGLLSLSLVAYQSGYLYDGKSMSALARSVGALVLWDLSHAAGAVEISLRDWGADMAVGCGYKYLNGGPGAPAFLYVRADLSDELSSPIPGWFGHEDAFAFRREYRPVAGVGRFLVGTPPVLSSLAMEAGLDILNQVGVPAVREKSMLQTRLFLELWQDRLVQHGLSLASPTDPDRRGAHITLAHADALAISQALIHRKKVIPDFRPPNGLRLGLSPLYTSFADIEEAVVRVESVMREGSYEPYRGERPRIT